jgi:hypothetical protein
LFAEKKATPPCLRHARPSRRFWRHRSRLGGLACRQRRGALERRTLRLRGGGGGSFVRSFALGSLARGARLQLLLARDALAVGSQGGLVLCVLLRPQQAVVVLARA